MERTDAAPEFDPAPATESFEGCDGNVSDSAGAGNVGAAARGEIDAFDLNDPQSAFPFGFLTKRQSGGFVFVRDSICLQFRSRNFSGRYFTGQIDRG